MIPVLIAVGVAYLFLRDRDSGDTVSEPQDPMPEEPTPEGFDPSQYPDTMEEVWSNDDGLVKVFKIGVHYGGEGGSYRYYFVIGNENGTSFVSESQAGTSDLKRKRFSTKKEAIEYIERPRDNDPNDPTSPQPQPEEEDDPTPRPSLPPRPDYGFGGLTNLSSGIGGL